MSSVGSSETEGRNAAKEIENVGGAMRVAQNPAVAPPPLFESRGGARCRST
jgi:hypothetical protein